MALTDDIHLFDHAERWNVKVGRLTKGDRVPERTAAVIWSVLSRIHSPVFLWNVFPLHPYEAGNPFSNRAHNSRERAAGEEVLSSLIKSLKPKRVIAIGNDAESSARKISPNCHVIKVRHPSYGGQNIFLSQIQTLYDINVKEKTLPLFEDI